MADFRKLQNTASKLVRSRKHVAYFVTLSRVNNVCNAENEKKIPSAGDLVKIE